MIATLAYLAVQVRQNTKVAKASSQRELNNAFRASFFEGMAEHRALIVNGLHRFEGLSRDEQWRFSFLMSSMIADLDQALGMFRQGLESQDNVTIYGNIVLAFIRERGGRQWFDIAKLFGSRPMVDYLDDRLRHLEDLPPRISTVVPWFQADDAAMAEA